MCVRERERERGRDVEEEMIDVLHFWLQELTFILYNPFYTFPIVITEHYPQHLEPLVQQCMEWCDAYHHPILVPLSSWLPDPRADPPLVTQVDCEDGGVGGAIIPTPSNQHLFMAAGAGTSKSNNGDIKMYHVASSKLIRTLSGRWYFSSHSFSVVY